jgi:hypothetical protein
MILEGKLMHPAEVMPVTGKLGRICAEFVDSAFNTIHNDVRADYYQAAIESLEFSNRVRMI